MKGGILEKLSRSQAGMGRGSPLHEKHIINKGYHDLGSETPRRTVAGQTQFVCKWFPFFLIFGSRDVKAHRWIDKIIIIHLVLNLRSIRSEVQNTLNIKTWHNGVQTLETAQTEYSAETPDWANSTVRLCHGRATLLLLWSCVITAPMIQVSTRGLGPTSGETQTGGLCS